MNCIKNISHQVDPSSRVVSIVMPCLNEAETLPVCIKKAWKGLNLDGIKGEVIVADNGSTDGSVDIALSRGARVVNVKEKGYGNALRCGIEAAGGQFIVIGDADDSYDFSNIEAFIRKLEGGYDLVMGCRMPQWGGKIETGAMPWKHRWIGNPVLSFIGRLFFKSSIHDFHCGLRAFTKKAYEKMDLHTAGMEFASEMVIKATLNNLRVCETPITLFKDGRTRPPHLRSWRDGWRHLRFMLLFSPKWLFLYPGLILMILGLALSAWLLPGPRNIGFTTLDIHTLLYACVALLTGFQAFSFSIFAKLFAVIEDFHPNSPRIDHFMNSISLETGVIIGTILSLLGIAGSVYAVTIWGSHSYGPLVPSKMLRIILPSTTLFIIGIQTILSSFLLSVICIKKIQN